MASEAQLLFGIESIRSAVARVAGEWNAADIARLESARILLESSLAQVTPAVLPPAPSAGLRQAALNLKKETAGIERLLDAAAAFVRSSPAGPSDYSQAYTVRGEIRAEISAVPAQSYAG